MTSRIYTLIKEKQFGHAIADLVDIRQSFSKVRVGSSWCRINTERPSVNRFLTNLSTSAGVGQPAVCCSCVASTSIQLSRLESPLRHEQRRHPWQGGQAVDAVCVCGVCGVCVGGWLLVSTTTCKSNRSFTSRSPIHVLSFSVALARVRTPKTRCCAVASPTSCSLGLRSRCWPIAITQWASFTKLQNGKSIHTHACSCTPLRAQLYPARSCQTCSMVVSGKRVASSCSLGKGSLARKSCGRHQGTICLPTESAIPWAILPPRTHTPCLGNSSDICAHFSPPHLGWGFFLFVLPPFFWAVSSYGELSKLFPDVEYYQMYHAQSLYKACQYEEAMNAARNVESPEYSAQVTKLKAAIRYGEEDLSASRALIEECPTNDPDTQVNEACLFYAEGEHEKALEIFTRVFNEFGYRGDLSYNMALCYYRLKQYAPALKHIADIIERGIREHPELSVGMATEGIEVKSVGNTQLLGETALIEAFNLKSSIEYQLKNMEGALEALTDMPPRGEEELDPVTLHNVALINMDEDANSGFEKLQFLLQQNPCPPETFGNLLLLYCKYEHYDLAADVMAENFDLTYKLLSQYVYDYLDATITQQTSPEEGFRKFDAMSNAHTEQLRKLTKQVQQARQQQDDEEVKRTVNEYDEALERYIPVLMAQAKIYWDLKNYAQVEKIFRKSVEFCNEHDVWKLNVAHVRITHTFFFFKIAILI